ncbi:MAG TPA: TIGR03000 domain-containing protein [Gemmataceae bacterium]|nr:TIGR03000 domain-containing protein [Gemmataceae bacterium]
MAKQHGSTLLMLTAIAGLLFLLPRKALTAPPVFSNNPYPQSFYNFNPGYYGPYYPGQYRYGSVNPGIYNNYVTPTFPGSGATYTVPLPYSAQVYGSASTFGAPPLGSAPLVQTYNYRVPTYNPPMQMAPSRTDRQVQADVHLPTPDAELWVEGHKTNSTGSWRRFSSPPLAPGERYVYEFHARWLDNGRVVERSRKVPVEAGERVFVDFTTSPGSTS